MCDGNDPYNKNLNGIQFKGVEFIAVNFFN